MEPRVHLKNLWQYNQWANEKLFAAIPSEVADVEITSSFNTIRKTVYHMWDAETVWLERLKELPITPWPASAQFLGSFTESFSKILEQENQYIEFIGHVDLEQKLSYKNLRGIEFNNTFFEIFSHVANHSTFHRGQVVTMLRQAGVIEIPSTDLITYYRR